MIKRAYAAMGEGAHEYLLQEIKALKEQPQLRPKKQRLEIRVTELTAELAVKSEEVWKFHVEQEGESMLGWIKKYVTPCICCKFPCSRTFSGVYTPQSTIFFLI